MPGLEGSPGINGVSSASGGGIEKFLSVNVGFFEHFYNSKLIITIAGIKYSSKNIYLRYIYIFINKKKDIIFMKIIGFIRKNL